MPEIKETVHELYGRDSSRNWSSDQNINMLFLQTIENWLNDRLKSRGHVFLNEVYDELGLRRTSQGAISGWLRSSGNPIRFGIQDPALVNEGDIALVFVTDGVIYDKIEEES